ncbi:D-2-hydroxyglutarate dehydrogenase, mitochondrial [Ischnura elegans]|uniref:D-2-hydroxyglutarate dehydrogenase, mitochondrial n=1 Tax=Ischnura elegans TaxID=197161 RepID=UPI001ED8A107|nr:D-2-hydroxyglutarate dehydrogenase, mitochondrial [Ischnura elegans]
MFAHNLLKTARAKHFNLKSFHTSIVTSFDVELTQVRYSNLKRGKYSSITDKHISFFESILSKSRVLTDAADVESYNVDWLKTVRGASKAVLKPKTTEEVSAILRYCNENVLAVCPQGGNTGLVGGSVPVFDEIVLSTALMNEVISINKTSGVLVCQAGCILENLEAKVAEQGLMMPLDLGAKGSCHIGGNISTNAGGIRLLRYGSLHGSVLGVEAVKADGTVVDCLSTLKKDNTGYHLKHLFLGSEGTLGVVTKAAIQCPPKPQAVNVAFLALDSFENVLATFRLARSCLGEILSSFEFMDCDSLMAAVTRLKLQCPVPEDTPFSLLIETSGGNSEHDEAKLSLFLDEATNKGYINDGTLASEPSRIKNLWDLREGITQSLSCDGYVYKYDISLPIEHFYDIVDIMKERLKGTPYIKCCGYGHVGDGNLHLNITAPSFDRNLLNLIEPFVYEWTSKHRGSVSAEHGIGFKKTGVVHFSKSGEALKLMAQIKAIMDPKGILNPYKVLPGDPH